MQNDSSSNAPQAHPEDVNRGRPELTPSLNQYLDNFLNAQSSQQGPSHTCPITGEETPTYDPSFPNTVSQTAGLRAVDAQGRRVEFYNESTSGGLIARHINSDQAYEENREYDCRIDGVACRGIEFHMGGTGIVPVN